ncbi:MAG TPA: hypothetical protein VGF48_23225 [Thermoanaerobaculia bacterium]|jgi:hypothetical protein
MAFSFSDNEKFSLIAIDSCFTHIEEEIEFPDGTWILPKMPATVDAQWVRWIGETRADRLKDANLIILRRLTSENPGILDVEHTELYQQVFDIWTSLQLSGIVYCADASAVQGSIEKGRVDIRQMVHLDSFYLSNKSPQYPVTIERLKEAIAMAAVWREMIESGNCERFIRGGVILRDGYLHRCGQNRIHQFTRAIEGLIKPDVGATTKQFKTRPQTFGVKGNAFEKILYESYEMRCDVEHVHAADRFLRKNYPDDQIENVAALRTRQMEVIARESYRRILTNAEIREHFETEDSLAAFWALPEHERKKIWGEPIDVTGFTDEDEYNEKVRQLRERHP